MDWWDSKRIQVNLPIDETRKTDDKASSPQVTFDVTCTPGQHFTGRSLLDNFKSLWASWVVEEVLSTESNEKTSRPATKVFFAGDTGYRAVLDGQDEDTVATCPAFKEIGERFGGFDFAMIPIG